jgi:hypothetical protein
MADASSTDELATTTTPHFECIGNFVLILGYQCGKQIVKVNHFSASRSRFQTCKENKLLSACRIQVKHAHNCAMDSGAWLSPRRSCC